MENGAALSSGDERFGYIDFIKGIAIINVLLCHLVPDVWYHKVFHELHMGQASILFITVSFFLSFNKLARTGGEGYYTKQRFMRLATEVVRPWLLVMVLQALVLGLLCLFTNFHVDFCKFIIRGGYGPGSYYIFVFLEFWLLMPLIYKIVSVKRSPFAGAVALLAICVGIELFCKYLNFSEDLYRLLFFRYLFAAVIAYVWLKDKRVKWWQMALLSLVSLTYWYVCDNSFEPFTFSGNIYYKNNWPAYFYTLLFVKLLVVLYGKVQTKRVAAWVCHLGRESWFIFLSQMFVLALLPYYRFSEVCDRFHLNGELLRLPAFIVIVLVAVAFCVRLLKTYQKWRSSFPCSCGRFNKSGN